MQTRNDQMQDIIRHFSARSGKYEKHLDWVNDENILDLILEDLPENGTTILDLGAGTGAVAKHILNKCGDDYKIVAVDICQDMLNQINDARIETICSNAENLPFGDSSFDAVISRQCLHYVEDLEKALNEVQRILKPNGIFILAQIVPFDKATSSDWASIIKIRQPLRKWYYTSEEWDTSVGRHSLILQSYRRYTKDASVGKWAEKYGSDENTIWKYKQKLLSMDKEYKEKYAICKMGNDVNYQTFWHIAKYSKDVTTTGGMR